MSFHYEERVTYVLCTLCGASFEGDPSDELAICDPCREAIQAGSKEDPSPAA